MDIFIDCDNVVEMRNAKNSVSGDYLNSGTATFTLTDNDTGTEITSGVLDYVASSNGKYRVVIDKSATSGLVEDNFYTLKVVFTQTGIDDTRYERIRARRRT